MLVSMQNISREYRKGNVHIPALQELDLSIAEGEFLAIMGPSGSGKSTLLHLLGCLDRPSAGRYTLDDIDVAGLSDSQLSHIRHHKIGFIFQSFHLLPQYSVLQNIEAPLFYEKTPHRTADTIQGRTRAEDIAGRIGLGERLHHRPSELSGGEMQRTAIARALVMNPRVILADEPTGNLDSKTGREIMSLLQELHKQGRTIILVTHEAEIAACAERIIHLKDGRIDREEIPPSPPLEKGGEQLTPRLEREGGQISPVPPLEKGDEESSSERLSEKGKTNSSPSILNRVGEGLSSVPPFSKGGAGGILTDLPYAPLLKAAVKAVLLHKLRSFLSVLGIVFGVGAIIAMLAIGAGAKQEILEQIELLGSSSILVKARVLSDGQGRRGREELSEGLSQEDVERIASASPSISAIAPIRQLSLGVQFQQKLLQCELIGSSPDYYNSAGLELAEGRFLTSADLRDARRVCVLGDELRQDLFAFRNPIGEMLKIHNDWFRVVGTLQNKTFSEKQSAMTAIDNINRRIIIPLSASNLFLQSQDNERIQEISILVNAPKEVDTVARLIRSMLTRLHHGAQDYEVIVPRELLKQSQQAQEVFNIVMSSIAGISLLVGGIGIMNIMLATVSERTREIGIRRAIGADRKMILTQFLLETLVLTLLGGVVGVLLGIGGAALISLLAGWRTLVSLQTIFIAVGISALIGIVFGLYPASLGADMDPICALRYE